MLYHYATTSHSTTIRTLILWLLSNVGGTLWLLLDFAAERLTDYSIALLAGMVAAIISLAVVPLVIPFFTVMSQVKPGWSRRSMALGGILLLFLLTNQLLVLLSPVDSLRALLPMSLPYGVAAVLTVFWLYGPAQRQVVTAME
ncbi:hypothetical protein ACFPAF_16095 [Hymenobacter endophyticus]|uniref:Uncharacterized protein n=1 Tax=Hymenobacter endophyticus TaxID=3076335 RepID=A0ABU3TKM3_9BACT|nr:hypothetical protein [Hymenobacter endophyticus]MDU0371923.1 hypothetical protein [Hymenobacter endophyticus]